MCPCIENCSAIAYNIKCFLCVQDDAFEDAIVDFFSIADANMDGVIDYNDFYNVSTVLSLPFRIAKLTSWLSSC